jgi:hypothetical protein
MNTQRDAICGDLQLAKNVQITYQKKNKAILVIFEYY